MSGQPDYRSECGADPLARRRILVKELALRGAMLGPDFTDAPTEAGPLLRTRTKILFLVIIGLPVATAILWVTVPRGRPDLEWLVIPAVVLLMAAIFAPPLLSIFFVQEAVMDLVVPGPTRRTSPKRGLKAFLCGMRVGKFDYAYQCLVPGERDDSPRWRPGFAGFPTPPEGFSIHTPEGFREYWEPLVMLGPDGSRRISLRGWRVQADSDDFALVSCEVGVTRTDRSWKKALTDVFQMMLSPVLVEQGVHRESYSLVKLMRRIAGQWYVVNGAMSGPEDSQEALQDAVRISKLTDSELKSELARVDRGNSEA